MVDEATLTKRRIEACVKQALMNAKNHGGDNAETIMDLICAAILIASKSGYDPDRILDAVAQPAKHCVSNFWPDGRMQ